MNIIVTFIFFINIAAFRLLTLDQLGEKNKDIFIANIDSKPKLLKVTPDNIPNFYVVVHSNKIFFYTKGNYHSFAHDIDNVKLKLSPVELGKMQFYTQENYDSDNDQNNHHKIKGIKVMKWDDLIKKPASMTKVTESRKIENFKAKPILIREQPIVFHSPLKAIEENKEEPGEPEKAPNETVPLKDDSKSDYKEIIKSLYDIIKNPKKSKENFNQKAKKDIESDSEMIGPKSLNITIDVVNDTSKTFVLKNDKNLCVTYFQKAFLLTECSNSKRQVFKLVRADEVLSRFQDQLNKPKEQDDEFLNEITASAEKAKEEEPKQENKMEEETPRESRQKRRPKRPTKIKKKPVSISADSERSDSQSNKPQIEENPKAPRPVKIPTFNNQVENKLPEMKEIPLPPNFENHCRAILQRNNGRIDLLPPGCDRVLKLGRYAPNNNFKPPFSLSMKLTTKPQMRSESREVISESREEAKNHSEFFGETKNLNVKRPINLIERLERELKM